MRRAFWLAALSACVTLAGMTACKGKDDKKESADKKTTDGKKAATDDGAKSAKPGEIASADDLASRYQDCIAFARARDYDKLATCYATDAVSTSVDFLPPVVVKGREGILKDARENQERFPESGFNLQMLLVRDDKELVSIGLTHARQDGEDGEGGFKIGVMGANHSFVDKQGAVTSEEIYMDQGTILGQLGAIEMPAPKAADPDPAPPVVVVAQGSDSEAKNLAMVTELYKAMNAHDAAKVLELYADDAEYLYMPSPEEVRGKDKLREQLGGYFKMTTDVAFTTEWAWAAGEYVVAGITAKGTNNGPIPGGIEASGEKFEVRQVDVYRVREGKISQQRTFTNGYAFAVQLDLMPDPSEGDVGDEGEGE